MKTYIKKLATNDEDEDPTPSQLVQAETVTLRDMLHTIIETLKVQYRNVQQVIKTCIFESVCAVAYMVFGLTESIHSAKVKQQIKHGVFQDLADPNLDPFSSAVVATLKSAGMPVSLKVKQENKRVLCTYVENGEGMFLNNVLEILGVDSPIQLILKMNNTPWAPGDFVQKGLYTLQLYHSVGINSFIVQNDLGILAA